MLEEKRMAKSRRSRYLWIAAGVGLTLSASARPAISGGTSRDQQPIVAGTVQPQKTVWDGVFTKEQAARGLQYYRRSCGHCHADDLSGGGDGEPALAGTIFLAQWHKRSVGELFSLISETMPYSAPGRLPGQEYVDILSYILAVNGAPEGNGELSFTRKSLDAILMIDPAAVGPCEESND